MFQQPWKDGERLRFADALHRLEHRGPDDQGEEGGPGWWLGFRRLAIQDLSKRGHQPMRFGNGRWTLVFNGEIYNFKELRAQMPHFAFQSTGDAEVLGALLTEHPVEKVLGMLRGMFSFVWFDEHEHSLVAARDGFGIKPFYYSEQLKDGGLIFGSELHAVANLSDRPKDLSAAAVTQFLRWGSVQGPDTILTHIRELPPGHYLRWSPGQLRVERYFLPQWPDSHPGMARFDDCVRDTRREVMASIQQHLVSDVPVGVFLSGGLDSTIMAAGMKALGQSDVRAFSIGYEVNAGVPDETDTAERTAKFLGCEFVRERATAQSVGEQLDAFFASLDQPTGDALNTYLVSQVAARSVKVVLSGLGADEWFGGYNYHRLVMLAQISPVRHLPLSDASTWVMQQAHPRVPAWIKGSQPYKMLRHLLGGAGWTSCSAHVANRSVLSSPDVAALTRQTTAQVDAVTLAKTCGLCQELIGENKAHWLQDLLLLETQTYLSDTLLRDNDFTSMAHSLELRVPLVDRQIFDLAGRVPGSYKLDLLGGKRVLRAAFDDLLPPWIRQDQKKKTFTLPLMKWLRHPLWKARVHDVLLSPQALLTQWLDPKAVRQVVEAYYHSSATTKHVWHLSQPVWMLLVLESWLQHQRARTLSWAEAK